MAIYPQDSTHLKTKSLKIIALIVTVFVALPASAVTAPQRQNMRTVSPSTMPLQPTTPVPPPATVPAAKPPVMPGVKPMPVGPTPNGSSAIPSPSMPNPAPVPAR